MQTLWTPRQISASTRLPLQEGGATISDRLQSIPALHVARVQRLRQIDAGLAIDLVQFLHGAVAKDRPNRRVHAGNQPLRLAERICKEHARLPGLLIRAPPGVDLREDLRLRDASGRSAVRRCDSVMKVWQRTGSNASHVRSVVDLVIARNHPHVGQRLQCAPATNPGRVRRDVRKHARHPWRSSRRTRPSRCRRLCRYGRAVSRLPPPM